MKQDTRVVYCTLYSWQCAQLRVDQSVSHLLLCDGQVDPSHEQLVLLQLRLELEAGPALLLVLAALGDVHGPAVQELVIPGVGMYTRTGLGRRVGGMALKVSEATGKV